MALKFFDAVIYLPIIVVCIIISQIYFERYWSSYNKSRVTRWGLDLIVASVYFIQEFCLLQLSILNIQEVAFMQVVSITMVFRNELYHLWWMLLAVTPLFVNSIEYFMGIIPFSKWWYWIGESLLLRLFV